MIFLYLNHSAIKIFFDGMCDMSLLDEFFNKF